ncbi:MAG: methyltransferase domain-containing protein, partial [Thermomicrobiales bacterium]
MSAEDDFISHSGDLALKMRHLDTVAQESTQRKQQVYARLQVREGQRVLDVGCGVGVDTLPLARLVGPAGRVEGVDVDAAAVAEANRRAAAAGMREWVEHQVCDAETLPFADDSFDACHSERVFMHLIRPEAVFAEIVRVT